MKITVNYKDITETITNILLAILLVMCIVFAYDNSNLKEDNKEIKARYNLVQNEKTELLKQLKEASEQPSIVNNLDTRY